MSEGLTPRSVRALDLHGAFIRRTDLSNASLVGANPSYADCGNAIFRGADLTDVRNLTREQLAEAVIDENTKLPAYLRSREE